MGGASPLGRSRVPIDVQMHVEGSSWLVVETDRGRVGTTWQTFRQPDVDASRRNRLEEHGGFKIRPSDEDGDPDRDRMHHTGGPGSMRCEVRRGCSCEWKWQTRADGGEKKREAVKHEVLRSCSDLDSDSVRPEHSRPAAWCGLGLGRGLTNP